MLETIDWRAMLLPDTPLTEIFIRGSVMYLALYALMRIMKRQAGGMSTTDLLVVVLVADAAQNGMAHDYSSLPDGIFLVMTLIFWNVALEWLGYHFPPMAKILYPEPLPLVKDGQMIRRNMRQELVTRDELMSQLREQGISEISEVRKACIEANGRFSVLTFADKKKTRAATQARATPS
ncbi:MAG: DUF421 domain-containing protein [Alphaproteobacteria bacterium]|nr:DUF421 domain-containing protein [Alphaproteobacteria bacterium]